MSPWPLGIVASSVGASAIPATVLFIDGGGYGTVYGEQFFYDYSWNCYVTTRMHRMGGNAGKWGYGPVDIATSAIITVGAAGGGSSSLSTAQQSYNWTVGNSGTTAGYSITTNNSIWFTGQNIGLSYCNFSYGRSSQANYNAGGGKAGFSNGGNFSSINGQNGITLSEFQNLVTGGGGGGASDSSYYYPGVTGNTGTSGSYGRGQHPTAANATAGVVIIKYADIFPLPTSGSYSHVTTGGFRYITCGASTTLEW